MVNPFKPVVRIGGYRSVPFGFLGMAMTAVPFPVALLPAVLIPGDTKAKLVYGVLAMGVLVALAGLPGPMRRVGIWFSNQMLGTRIAQPPPHTKLAWAERWRSAGWLLVHTALGWVLFGLGSFLMLGFVFAAVWAGGGGSPIEVFGERVTVESGTGGLWTLPIALGTLVLIAYLLIGFTRLFQYSAVVLLGPSAAERVAAAEVRANHFEQRNRLARELHDSIGHTLTTSTIQAAAAAELVESQPQLARQALGTIEESSRMALEDLDHVLGLLREDRSSREPERRLIEVATLAERARSGGAVIDYELTGPAAELPATLSREAYRIVQEGLTNALRHAHPGPVTVRVAVLADALRIEIVNPLREVTTDSGRGGNGLPGLTERVEALRGELVAGPAMDGEPLWRLVTTIPLRSRS
ncbi:sensor histidine kinase [Amycolatopsis regifaucium]|uniref:histidine kinase n=1 Tax=Amycolatopsis regifaucium TaxID=546365 RepID=A0A154MAC1_9PSEU|nr:histidine kinase [Amycolatopsis regifaucium]KZB80709.1 histidine kinase [Amycolatopsis regifaucium]OKA07753.1 sensor histidine kinase [Amycolatopsis regifaucium]SFH03355.1 Signal transduction histidine kinase [Amycolatopsis regifaucium]